MNCTAPPTLRYGFIGCGMMGQEHLRNLALVPGSVVTRVFEPDDGMAARSLELAPQAHRATSLEAVVEAADVDALVITSPNFRHAEQLQRIAALRAMPVLLEKPACTSLEQVRALQALARRAGAPVWVRWSTATCRRSRGWCRRPTLRRPRARWR
jgi:myo-inositol 2-dehydrogenase / D-chiro-inositol 1-dehydrogenase